MFAIQRKNPVIKVVNPPIASLLREYPPPGKGKLVESSEKFNAVKKIKIPPIIKLIRTPGPATSIAGPSKINMDPPIPHPIPYSIP